MKLKAELINRAGLDAKTIAQGRYDTVFVEILNALESIHQGKGVLYGDYIKTHGSDTPAIALAEHFADIKRKYTRAENCVRRLSANEELNLRALLDTYSDLAVYSALGIHLVAHLSGEEIEVETQTLLPKILDIHSNSSTSEAARFINDCVERYADLHQRRLVKDHMARWEESAAEHESAIDALNVEIKLLKDDSPVDDSGAAKVIMSLEKEILDLKEAAANRPS